MRSPRIMSILLYVLGAGLFVSSGLMLLSGETFATLDIAASLAGSGAFTIGLGAIADALDRLTRAVGGVGATAKPRRFARREEPIADIVPVFVPRGAEPAHFEPLPEHDLQPKSEPVLHRRPEPRLDPPPPGPEAADAEGAPGEQGLSKKERRALKLLAKQQAVAVDTPPIVVPALGGGPAPAAVRPAAAEKPIEADPDAASASAADEAVDRSNEVLSTAEIFERARPIMPVRAPLSPRAGPPLRGERSDRSLDATSEATPEGAPDGDETPEPEIGVAAQARERAAAADRSPRSAPDVAGPIAAHAVEPEPGPASTPPDPEPKAPPVESRVPATSPDVEPKVPDWLARARARREARAKAEAPAAPSPEGPAPAVPAIDPPEPEPEEAKPPAAADTDPEADEPEDQKVVSEGEHNGVLYRFYDDGSVEAVSAYGVRRFASVDELRETVRSVRGPDDLDLPPDAAGTEDPAPGPAADPLDAALAELEREPATAPELKVDPQDRPGPRERW